MQNLLDRYLYPARENEGSGAGNGAGAAGGAGGDGGAGTAVSEGGGGAGGQGGSGQVGGTPPPEPYFPEGLPDDWKGKDAKETLDKLFSVAKGYRDRDAGKDVPEKPEGYLTAEGIDEKVFKLDDRFKPHFEHFAQDPGMIAAAKVAKENGVSRPVFLKAMQEAMGALSEAGMLEPMVDAAAERAALLPESHKNSPKDQQDVAINRRMEENLAFVDLMVANKGLDKEVGEYAQLMLADSAKGHRFLEFVRGQLQGGGQGPGAHGGAGGGTDTRESLKAELAKPEMQPGHPMFDKSKWADLDARYKKLLGG